MSARHRATVKEALERHLRYEPQKVSRSRIERLRGLSKPQYRLRGGEIRVFYGLSEARVEVLAIVRSRLLLSGLPKKESRNETHRAVRGEGSAFQVLEGSPERGHCDYQARQASGSTLEEVWEASNDKTSIRVGDC